MADTMKQISFAKLAGGMQMPHLLDIQTRAFEALLQLDAASQDREDIGLERVFKDLFPITDVHENFSLEFVKYSLGEPKYSVEECIERDMTYSAPLKATLQLVINEEVNGVKRPRNIIEKEVYLGELPLLTPLGTFVINGAERVVVSQLHRSPGAVFEESTHPNGQRLISARIIPFRGSWVEFTVDIHDVIYVHIDKKKKFPATALLRAFGYGSDSDIYHLFFGVRELDLIKVRQNRQEQRELAGAIIAEQIVLPGREHDPDAPKPKTKKAKAEQAAAEAERTIAVGTELTDELAERLRELKYRKIKVFASYMTVDLRDEIDAHRARRARGAATSWRATSSTRTSGEVLAEADQALTPTLIKKLRKADVTKVQVLRPVGPRRVGAHQEHADQGPDALRRRGAQADLLAAASRRRAQQGDGPAGARPAVLLAQAVRSGPRGSLQDQPAARASTARPTRPCSRAKTSSRSSATSSSCTRAAATPTTSTTSGNRRIRSVGELIANQFSVGLSAWRAWSRSACRSTPIPRRSRSTISSTRAPCRAVIQAFFGSSQLSQFMDQTNPARGADAQAPALGARARAGSRASAPASKCATCTTRSTAACARSRRLKVRTSDSSRRSPATRA